MHDHIVDPLFPAQLLSPVDPATLLEYLEGQMMAFRGDDFICRRPALAFDLFLG